MKTPSDNLHQLIKSLTVAERRYFKNYLQKNSTGNATISDKLIDAIHKQSTYNEEQILEKFKGEALVNNFAVTKSRLYDSILKSLDLLYSESSIEATLKRDLHYVEILFKKALYEQAAKILNAIKKTAVKYEKISTLIEISNWEKRLLENTGYSKDAEEDIVKIQNLDSRNLENLQTFNRFWNVKSKLFSELNKGGKARNEEELNKFKSFMDKDFEHDENSLNIENKYIYHHTYSAFYFSVGDYENSYIHLASNAKLIEENTHLFAEEPNVYFSGLTNIIFICSQLKKHDEAFLYLRKLHDVNKLFQIDGNFDLETKLFSSANSIEITLYKTLGKYEEALQTALKIEADLPKFEAKLTPTRKAFFYFNIAASYFANNKLKEALKWSNELINDKSIDENENIKCFTYILQLMIHIELKNMDYLPNVFKTVQRYLDNKNRVFKFEKIFLDFINDLTQSEKSPQIKLVYEKLIEDLNKIKEDNFEREPFEYFDYITWAKSRASGIPFLMLIES